MLVDHKLNLSKLCFSLKLRRFNLIVAALPGSAINSAFGSRVTVMIGGVLSCIGMIVISQSTNLWMAYTGSMITGRCSVR